MISNSFLISRFRSIMSTSNTCGPSSPIANAMTEKLIAAFTPEHLEVRNESYMHNVPTGSETHFKVIIVSEKFKEAMSRSLIARHRLVNNTLKDEVTGAVHALSIVALTPEQWQERLNTGDPIESSPKCRGGDGSLPTRN